MPKDRIRSLLRLPAALHQRIKARADELRLSPNSTMVHVLERGLTSSGVEQLEPLIVSMAKSQFGDAFIGLLLYGSRARGDVYETSDTDLLLVVAPTVRIERETYHAWMLRFLMAYCSTSPTCRLPHATQVRYGESARLMQEFCTTRREF
jgi:hypothetical protein